MNCQHCGKFFKDRPSDHRKFCSQQCTYAARWPKPVWYSEAVNLYNEGWSTIKLAERFNSNHGTISGWLKRDGLTRPLGERRPNRQFACKTCGKPFSGRDGRTRIYKYCSHKCCIEHRRTRSEWYQEAVALYKGGMGVKRIGKRYGIKSTMFAAQLKVDGHFIPNRHKTMPRWNKGVKLPKRYSWACIERLIMRGYKAERAKNQRFDDCGHWINHPERLNFKARIKEKRHADLKTNYFISKRIRSRVKSVMSGRTKSAPTLRLIGCTVDQLRLHLQSKFKRGMNWNNYGKVWHIDHIQPCASFDLSNPDEQARCFHFSNLQPLRALDNRVKHDKIVACQPELILRF